MGNPTLDGGDGGAATAHPTKPPHVNPAMAAPYPPESGPATAYPPVQPAPVCYPPPLDPYPPSETYPPPAAHYPPAGGQEVLGVQTPVTAAIWQPWSTGLFDFDKDENSAAVAMLLPCVTFGQIAEILDAGQTTCAVGSMVYLMLAPVACTCFIMGTTYRAKLRRRYNLVEAPAEDWVLHLCCPCCALAQEFRELKLRGIDPSKGYMGNVAEQKAAAMAPPQPQFMGP